MAAIASETRKSGIDVVGDMPWGTHFCLFYDTKEDLLDTLSAYCKAGLEAGEFCLWVVAAPLTIDEAVAALKTLTPQAERYLADGSIEIVSARHWYITGGTFDLKRVTSGWHEKLARASARGYAGVRVTGDTAWLEKKDWKDFCEYEEGLNEAVLNQRLAVLCTYPLAVCGAVEILDVVRTHQFAIARRRQDWEVIETAGLKQAKAEIKKLNDELEQRVAERTSQRNIASEALREAWMELAHVNRVTTMGQLVASIAHEINNDQLDINEPILEVIAITRKLSTTRDSGAGLEPGGLVRLFDAFYTTKPSGMGDGALDLPFDHRSAWRPRVGYGERTSRCRLHVHAPGKTVGIA